MSFMSLLIAMFLLIILMKCCRFENIFIACARGMLPTKGIKIKQDHLRSTLKGLKILLEFDGAHALEESMK